MASSSPGFNAAGFRKNIKFAMVMGAAVDVADRVTFHFPAQLTYNGVADGDQVPFDPQVTVTSAEPPTKQVDCAVEYFDSENQPTNFGLIAPSRLLLTLLDEDYEQVKECSYVVVHGDRYDYRRTQPPLGLFEVGVYQMHFTSNSET